MGAAADAREAERGRPLSTLRPGECYAVLARGKRGKKVGAGVLVDFVEGTVEASETGYNNGLSVPVVSP